MCFKPKSGELSTVIFRDASIVSFPYAIVDAIEAQLQLIVCYSLYSLYAFTLFLVWTRFSLVYSILICVNTPPELGSAADS